jgi:hypothetical protein
MKTATTVLQIWIRGGGVIMIALGLLFWTGNADRLIPVHMLLGITLVLALWALAILGGVAHVSLGLVVPALLWGAITPVLGLTQTRLLPGSSHWLIQVAHLLVGLGLIGLGETLARHIKHNRASHQTAPHASSFEGVTR